MKKTLIALAVLGATAGVAHAQSSVTLYGMVDTGLVKETDSSMKMDENHSTRLGFRGQEDLGNGLKATFQIEKRFKMNDGVESQYATVDGSKSGTGFDGAANMGLASNSWGQVRFGRMDELSTETYRKLDPFNQDGIASGFKSSQRMSGRISNTVRYDSPTMSGFKAGVSYTLSKNNADTLTTTQRDVRNAGYGLNLTYNNGPVMLLANWSRISDSNDSSVWNLGGAYSFGDVKVSLGYERTKDEGYTLGYSSGYKGKQDNWIVGLAWKLGPGELGASFNHGKFKDTATISTTDNPSAQQYSLGYTYNISKRTSAYANISYGSYDNANQGNFYRKLSKANADNDSYTGYAIGMTHKF